MNLIELAAQILVCPDCSKPLDAALRCTGCGRVLSQSDGILDALPVSMREDSHDLKQLAALVYRNGPGDHGERVVLFEKAFHDEQASFYDTTFAEPLPLSQYYRRLVHHHIYRYVRRAPFVVDLCCGTGKSSLPLLERGLVVVGIDVSLEMLRSYREKCRKRGLENLLLVHADASRPPLARNSCHAISVVGGLHHIQDRKGCIESWCGALVDSGVLLVHEPLKSGQVSKLSNATENFYALATPHRVVRALRRRLGRPIVEPLSHDDSAHSVSDFTPFERPLNSRQELLDLLPQKMKILCVSSRGDISFRNFPEYLQGPLGVPLAQGIVKLDDWFSQHRKDWSGDALFAVFEKA